MSETPLPASAPTTTAYGDIAPAGRSRWAGWITFAAFLMLMLGLFQGIKGLAAIVNPDFFADTGNRPVFDISHSGYGWVHLTVGALIFLTGLGVLSGRRIARIVAVILAVCSAVLTLADISVAPVWGATIVVFDLIVIYALVVHGGEMAE